MKTVICCGYLCCDLMATGERFPEENQKQFIESLSVSAGGPAANAACLLAQWGVNTFFFGRLGSDAFSDIALADLHHFGVHTDCVQRYDGPGNCAIIISNAANGSRTVMSKNVGKAYSLDVMPMAEAADGILVDGHEFEWSRQLLSNYQGISVLDAGSFREETVALLGMVSDPVASAPFYATLREKESNLQDLGRFFKDTLIVTNGEKPILELTQNNERMHPPFQVNAMDTLAAGDCFHGAYLFGRIHGLDVSDCIMLASAASGISTTRTGGCHSFPSLLETHDFLKRQKTSQSAKLSDHIAGQITAI